jgi:carbon storage regulator CsrA
MLALSRYPGETVEIMHNGELLTLHVVSVRGTKVRLAFDGPKSFAVWRPEVKSEKTAHDGPDVRQ